MGNEKAIAIAKQLEVETLTRLAHHLKRLCQGLMPNLNADYKVWLSTTLRSAFWFDIKSWQSLPRW